jgi:hypothetical protein
MVRPLENLGGATPNLCEPPHQRAKNVAAVSRRLALGGGSIGNRGIL